MSTAASTALTIAEESFRPFIAEAAPLLAQHWREIARYQDILLDVDVERYVALDEAGHLATIVARQGDRIVGYALFFLQAHPHYRHSVQALQDVVYVDPTVRHAGIGTALIETAERVLAARGCDVVYHHVKTVHPALGTLLERHGYEWVEKVYAKRLKGVD